MSWSHYTTANGQLATVVGEYKGLNYGFILNDDRGPGIIMHMRWNKAGKAINIVGAPYKCINWDLKI